MATVQDTLETHFTVTNLSAWQGALRAAGGSADLLERRISGLNRVSLAAGTAAAVGFGLLGKAALAAGEDFAVMQTAAANFKGAFPQQELEAFTAQLERRTGIPDDAIASWVGLLGLMGATRTQAEQLALPILNFSRAAGQAPENVARQIGRAIQTGRLDRLARIGIAPSPADIQRLGLVGAILDQLSRKGGTAAETFRNTLPGSLAATKTALGSLEESMGSVLAGPLTSLASGAANLVNAFNALPGPVKTVVSWLGVGLVGALGAVSLAAKGASAWTAVLMAQQVRATKAALDYAKAQGVAAGAATAAGGAAAGAAAKTGAAAAAGAGAAAAGAGAAGTGAGAAAAGGAAAGAAAGGGIRALGKGLLARIPVAGWTAAAIWSIDDLLANVGTPYGAPAGATAGKPGGAGVTGPKSEQQRTNELLEIQNELLRQLFGKGAAAAYGAGGGILSDAELQRVIRNAMR
jgi:hypothetical protein